MASEQQSDLLTLPQDFLLNPLPSPPIVRPIHFAQTPLVDYARYYAIVLDNVLSPEECDQLLQAAEATTNGKWEEAMVNAGGGRQLLATDVRNSGRIIWDSHTVTQRIWDRVKPYLESRLSDDAVPFDEGSETWEESKTALDSALRGIGFERKEGQDDADTKCILHDSGIGVIEGDKADVVGVWTKKPRRWVCQGLNERMRFLKYQDQQYFKRMFLTYPAPLFLSAICQSPILSVCCSSFKPTLVTNNEHIKSISMAHTLYLDPSGKR